VDYLKLFTLLSDEVIAAVKDEHERKPEIRVAQKKLAFEVTSLVHGTDIADRVQKISEVLYGEGDLNLVDANELRVAVPVTAVANGAAVVDVLISSGLATSKREAREFLDNGAVSINGAKIGQIALSAEHFRNGLAMMKRGKRNVAVLSLE
jgi:tyrosyl-tRNA synthetase